MANVCTVLQSEATATKYNLFDNNSSLEVVQSRTRQRKPQYIRDNNFVVPDGSVLWVMSAEWLAVLLVIHRRLRIQLVYLCFAKLFSINKKRVLIKFIMNISDIFTQIYLEEAAEYADINFVRIKL